MTDPSRKQLQRRLGGIAGHVPAEWPVNFTGIRTWDAAHAVARQFQLAALVEDSAEPYAEPDLLHQRYVPTSDVAEGVAPAGGAWPAQKGLDALYPPLASDSFALQWHLDRARFPAAWVRSTGRGVRIAHLDSGYYPDHHSAPRNMLRAQGWNYLDNNPDTTDPGHHLNAGHGTATLALLAGKEVNLQYTPPGTTQNRTYAGVIGGAPDAQIVPVRIGGVFGSMVHIYSSSMARDYTMRWVPRYVHPATSSRSATVACRLKHGQMKLIDSMMPGSSWPLPRATASARWYSTLQPTLPSTPLLGGA